MDEMTIAGWVPDVMASVPHVLAGDLVKANAEMHGAVATLIEACDELSPLVGLRIDVWWKAKTPTSGGKDVWGKVQKLTGLTEAYAGADYAIILSTEPCREMSNLQLEALLHEQLMKINVVTDDKTGKVTYGTRGHDASMFHDNVRRYGLWQDDLKMARRTFEQQPLPV